MNTSDARTELLQVVKTPDGFRVFDPEYVQSRNDVMEQKGRLVARTGAKAGFGSFAIFLVGGIALPLWLGGPWYLLILWVILGLAGGFILAGIGLAAFCRDDSKAYAKQHGGAKPELDVKDQAGIKICHVALDLASTDAWKQGEVDPQRNLVGALWQAARRSDQAEKLREWIDQSRRAGLGASQTAAAQHEEAELREQVGRTEGNLRELLGVAHQVTHAARRPGATAGPVRSNQYQSDEDDLSEQMLVHGHAVRDLLR